VIGVQIQKIVVDHVFLFRGNTGVISNQGEHHCFGVAAGMWPSAALTNLCARTYYQGMSMNDSIGSCTSVGDCNF